MCQSPGELGSNQSRRCAADIMWQSAAPSQRMLSYDSKNRAPVTTSGNSATRYAAGNDKSLFAILAILISILCMVCLLNVFIIHIHHQSLQRVSSKQYTAQYNYIYIYISNGCISLKYLQLFIDPIGSLMVTLLTS